MIMKNMRLPGLSLAVLAAMFVAAPADAAIVGITGASFDVDARPLTRRGSPVQQPASVATFARRWIAEFPALWRA